MSIGKIKRKKQKPAWEQTEDDILERLINARGWVIFGEFDNIDALYKLVKSGLAEVDPEYDNVRTSLITSFKVRATCN